MTRVYTFAIVLLFVSLPGIGSAAELQLRTFSTMNFSSNDQNSFTGSTGERRAFFIISAPVEVVTRPSRNSKATFRYTPHFTPRAAYAAMITRLDTYVGRILELLD